MGANDSLDIFHPLVSKWFLDRLGKPTQAQSLAWPHIAGGENVLVTAPTGSGKTLTAFLWALDRLIRKEWSPGAVRVLYISPMRALNNDIRRNLNSPLKELEAVFKDSGANFPPIRAMTRSGDTSQSDRRKMLRHPPEILITTPESLNILLTSVKGCDMLRHIETVILDEVHAVAGSKRGTHLITGVERLTRLSGEFQRIALSATVRPLDRIAKWVGGYETNFGTEGSYQKRPVSIIDAAGKKDYDVSVCAASTSKQPIETDTTGNPVWFALAQEVAGKVTQGNSTLVFANSRRAVEKMARLVNTEQDEQIVYSHHGSLSREIREVVEKRLKAGELSGIVATNSLELGIDVGAVDQVLLVETPPSISSTVQRIGRAGHGVGQTSRGCLYPVHSQDYVDAAVVIKGLLEAEVEPLEIPKCPLDVLAQEILSMTSTETWDLDNLYDFLRTAEPYQDLSRKLFSLVIDMLAGKYEGTRIPELKPRIALDRVDNTVIARPGVARLLYASGGTIPDRGYYTLRLADNGAAIGELDEEFVWERSVGETISLGVQSWKINRIGRNDVFVTGSGSRVAMAPFWRCEERFHDFWYSERRAKFLEEADATLDQPGFVQSLETNHCFTEEAATKLVRYLASQKKATGCSLPHRHHVLLEHIAYPRSTGMRPFTVLHTPWGGRVNRPLALAISAAYEERFGSPVDVMYEDGCVALELQQSPSMQELIELVPPDDLERLIRAKLESTGFFGAHFRENAARSLLLLKAGFKRRTPLWLNRQRAKELMESVSKYEDFPVLLETWRSCMQDEVDLANLKKLLDEVKNGDIEVSQVTTIEPSPFASEVLWKRTNEFMYEDDVPTSKETSLNSDLIKEVVFSSQLRPKITNEVIDVLTQKLQRTFIGYSPRDADDLIEWVKERVFIPGVEWRQLIDAMERDWQLDTDEVLCLVHSRVVALELGTMEKTLAICSVEAVGRIKKCLGLDESSPIRSATLDGMVASSEAMKAIEKIVSLDERSSGPKAAIQSELFGQWLRYYGPVPIETIDSYLGTSASSLSSILSILEDDQRIVVDEIRQDAHEIEAIDAENLARLLRMTRQRGRPTIAVEPIERLPQFLAGHHGLGTPGKQESLETALERLFGYAAPAALFEEEFLPARLAPYRTNWMDTLFAGSSLIWTGIDKQKLMFSFISDRELFKVPDEQEGDLDLLNEILPEGPGRYSSADLLTSIDSLSSTELTSSLWRLAWSGLVTNDTYEAVRQGIGIGFKLEAPAKTTNKRFSPRPRFSKWRTNLNVAGNWHRLPPTGEQGDAVDEHELNKDRARILLDRYGILFRELLARETGPLKWRSLFRTLRLMELSGEVMAGQFFKGISGVQFISPEGLKRIQAGPGDDSIYWMNAADPISPCGLALEGLKLPRRIPSTHLVFHGQTLVLISSRKGKSLDIFVPPTNPALTEYFAPLKSMLTRDSRPLRGITIEEINGEPASSSSYKEAFEKVFDTTRDHRSLRISRKY